MVEGRTKRKFGKHNYYWANLHKYKGSAESEVSDYRKKGYLARVTKTKRGNYNVWVYPDPYAKSGRLK